MSKPKVTLLVPTVGHKVGDTIEVDSVEIADELVRNRLAVRKTSAPSKSEKD